MNSKLVKTLCISFIMFFSVFFINIDNAMAIGTPDGNGYADCEYKYNAAIQNQMKQYVVRIAVFKNTDGNYDGYAVTACGKTTISQSNWDENACHINNYDALLYRNDLGDKFTTNGAWSCPKLFIKNPVSGASSAANITLSYTDDTKIGEKYFELERSTDYSKTTGVPTLGDGVYQGQQTTDIHDDQNESKDIGDVESVKKWGQETKGTNVSYKYGNCDLIPKNIRTFLSALFTIISVIGIILLIVMSAIEFIKALTGSDEDGLKGAIKHTFIRIICIIILLLLPMLIGWILDIANNNNYITNDNGNYVIGDNGDPLCKK